jgi:ribosome assembly protein 4
MTILYQPQAVFRVRAVGRCTASLNGHTEAILSVSFSPDGTQLATGSGDTTVRIWDLNTETPQHTLQGKST